MLRPTWYKFSILVQVFAWAILVTFFYQPTLDIWARGAAYIMGVSNG